MLDVHLCISVSRIEFLIICFYGTFKVEIDVWHFALNLILKGCILLHHFLTCKYWSSLSTYDWHSFFESLVMVIVDVDIVLSFYFICVFSCFSI